MREGPYFPEHGLARVVEFHERQDARYAEAAAAISAATGKPILVASELAVTDHDNAGPRAVREAGRYCVPSATRAVRRARAPLAPCPTSPPDGGGVSTTTRRVLAGLLVIAAAIVAFVAFSGGDSGAGPATTATPEATTPLWSVRRVPEPVVDAVGAQHLQAALDAATPGTGTCFVVQVGNHTVAAHQRRRPPHRCLDTEAARRRGGAGDPRTRLDLPDHASSHRPSPPTAPSIGSGSSAAAIPCSPPATTRPSSSRRARRRAT